MQPKIYENLWCYPLQNIKIYLEKRLDLFSESILSQTKALVSWKREKFCRLSGRKRMSGRGILGDWPGNLWRDARGGRALAEKEKSMIKILVGEHLQKCELMPVAGTRVKHLLPVIFFISFPDSYYLLKYLYN